MYTGTAQQASGNAIQSHICLAPGKQQELGYLRTPEELE